jgi:prevent-host-death family protein
MQAVGIKELKNRLTEYIRRVKEGERVVVTERAVPVAVLHSLDVGDAVPDVDERLAGLAKQRRVRLPADGEPFRRHRRARMKGRSAAETLVEERE